jgi:hypothetical protein
MCSLLVAILFGVLPVVLLVLVLDLVPPVARVLILFLDIAPRVACKMPVLGGCGRCILTNIIKYKSIDNRSFDQTLKKFNYIRNRNEYNYLITF